jgi:aspartate/methionine/tyrosine aminotransferase
VVCQVGIAQQAVAVALDHPHSAADVASATAEWQRRRDVVLAQLRGLPVMRPSGGWSLLVDTAAMGIEPQDASDRLLRMGRVAATPMSGWGPSADRYLRLVYANETTDRLATLRARVDDALGTSPQ